MRIFSIFGITKSGKTTTAENLIKELTRRRYRVGSIKEIHYEQFSMDTAGSNTHRHQQAGATLVTARGYTETDLLFSSALSLDAILSHYDHDFVVMEGVTDTCAPKIITAHTTTEVDERLDDTVFAISGLLANEMDTYRGLPVINSIKEPDRLADLIEEKVFSRLPDMQPDCCHGCGYDCRGLSARILSGLSLRSDCVLSRGDIQLVIDGRVIPMVPFVQTLLRNAVIGVAGELEGYRSHGDILVNIRRTANE